MCIKSIYKEQYSIVNIKVKPKPKRVHACIDNQDSPINGSKFLKQGVMTEMLNHAL
jgi:hypothetical protein